MFRSRTVTKQAYYECEFNAQSVFLTMISDAEAKANIGGPWYYMMPGQYVEGTSYKDSMVKTEIATITSTLIVPTNSMYPSITLPENFKIDSGIIYYKGKESKFEPKHTCSDFKWYYGLLEHYEYCVSCEKKR